MVLQRGCQGCCKKTMGLVGTNEVFGKQTGNEVSSAAEV